MAAARDIGRKKFKVILIEARDRIGGRAWTCAIGAPKEPAELGAEFIHGRAAATKRLLREAGLRSVQTGGDSWTSSAQGLRREETDFQAAAGIFDRSRLLDRDESVERFLQRLREDGKADKTIEMARTFVEGFDAADPKIASARAIAEEWDSGVDFASARPIGGYGPMLEYMRDECLRTGVDLRLSTVMHKVRWERAEVTIDARTALGEVQRMRARCAIVTVPAGVLRHAGDSAQIAFEPPLPVPKIEALANIEMGDAVKVVLAFRSRFWERLNGARYRNAAFFRSERRPYAVYWTQMPLRSQLITAWAGGPAASALRGVTSGDLISAALDGFAALFGTDSTHADFARGAVHDWTNDPFSRGAYSYVAVGGADARAKLAAAVDDTLFFAGEASSLDGYGGTVNGALETGERAAAEAVTALQNRIARG